MEIPSDIWRTLQYLDVPSTFKQNLEQIMSFAKREPKEEALVSSPPSFSEKPRYLPIHYFSHDCLDHKLESISQTDTIPDLTVEELEDEPANAIQVAQIECTNGDKIEFRTISEDGELICHLTTENLTSLQEFFRMSSPLQIFLSLTPSEIPVPWVIEAFGSSPQDVQFLEQRESAECLPNRVSATDNLQNVKITAPSSSAGFLDLPLAMGGYCGLNGDQAFKKDWCDPEIDPETGPIFATFTKCTYRLSDRIIHKSIDGGNWRRRRKAIGFGLLCRAGQFTIKHQYRKLGWSGWKWKTDNIKAFGPALHGIVSMSLFPRRRRVIYQRSYTPGEPNAGIRAWTLFRYQRFGGPDRPGQ